MHWRTPRSWRKRTYQRFQAGMLLLMLAILILSESDDVPYNIRFTVLGLGFTLFVVVAFTISVPWYREQIRRERNDDGDPSDTRTR